MRARVIALATAAAATVIGHAPLTSANAAPRPPVVIQNVLYNQALSTEGEETTAGSRVVISETHSRSSQQWEIILHTDGFISLKGVASGHCVDAEEGEKSEFGDGLVVRPCDETIAQRWIRQGGAVGGAYIFRNAKFQGMCLAGPQAATRAALQFCMPGNPLQQWRAPITKG
ncbi:RICIN domain-containing protein [Allokutzneria oryzae]|uniref:RICIN domain-containing protein n=1 Tax=Allokutzneria oryzae TaxID=1378989 RepID=A0ABV5ZNW0_9PSEU